MGISAIRRACVSDRTAPGALRMALCPDTSLDGHLRELDAILSSGGSGTLPIIILVSHDEDGALTGFLEAGMRSHADGCDPQRPVGFVEG